MTSVHTDEQIKKELVRELEEAEDKAWDSLARYKFNMFGYWAAIWVHLNRITGLKRKSPFTQLVKLARDQKPPVPESRVRRNRLARQRDAAMVSAHYEHLKRHGT